MNINQILKKELEEISLSNKEIAQLEKTADEIVKRISSKKAEAIIGGSLAKGTLIKRHVQDIDIFVVFDSEQETKNLGKILKKAKLKAEIVHGSRDYFQIKGDDVIFEIIPVVKNLDPEKAGNVTDVSLKHVRYVKSVISKNPELANQIKLAKAFCYAQNCYGAESYIRGFSGYALEVLICYFGSFAKFLRGIQKKQIIDPEKHFKSEKEILRELNESKLQGPVVLIDPTFKYRNIAASLGKETFAKFLRVSKKFLILPSLEFFKKKEISVSEIKKFAQARKAKFIELDLKTDKQEGDIAGTKMKKFFEFLCRHLEKKQQKVLRKEFDYSGQGKEAKGYLIVRGEKLVEVRGPLLTMRQAIVNFRKVHNKIFKKAGYLWAREKISLDEIFRGAERVAGEMGIEFVIKLSGDF